METRPISTTVVATAMTEGTERRAAWRESVAHPAPRDADPKKWGVAACTVDGQMFAHGDVDDYFSIQSTSKPVTYGMALAERGEDFVHSYIGGPNMLTTPPVPRAIPVLHSQACHLVGRHQ